MQVWRWRGADVATRKSSLIAHAMHAHCITVCTYVAAARPRGTEDRQTAVAARLRLPAGVGRAWHGLRALSAGTITSSATHGGIGIGRRPFQF